MCTVGIIFFFNTKEMYLSIMQKFFCRTEQKCTTVTLLKSFFNLYYINTAIQI